MKTCPICHAVAFDDALVCFGCMYRYEVDQDESEEPGAAGVRGVPDAQGAPNAQGVPDVQGVADAQGVPDVQVLPDAQAMPDMPVMPDAQGVPGVLDGLGEPNEADASDGLDEPSEPDAPDALDEVTLQGASAVYETGCYDAPGFVIKMVPVYEQSGAITWSCRVDLADVQQV